jgi:hypothetical protein
MEFRDFGVATRAPARPLELTQAVEALALPEPTEATAGAKKQVDDFNIELAELRNKITFHTRPAAVELHADVRVLAAEAAERRITGIEFWRAARITGVLRAELAGLVVEDLVEQETRADAALDQERAAVEKDLAAMGHTAQSGMLPGALPGSQAAERQLVYARDNAPAVRSRLETRQRIRESTREWRTIQSTSARVLERIESALASALTEIRNSP